MSASAPPPQGTPRAETLATLAPVAFVLFWSTGFVGAKMGLPYAEPFTFLALRFVLVTGLLLTVVLAFRAPWPKTWGEAGHIAAAGMLLHGTYFGGMYVAMSLGMPGGIAALIAGLQPIITAIGAGLFLGERVGARQWTGLVLGLGGVVLVVWDKLAPLPDAGVSVAAAGIGTLGIAAGTLYQKRFAAHMSLRTGSTIQFAVAALMMGVAALATETMAIQWSGEFIFAMAWLVFVLSLGTMSILLFLIRRGLAYKTASLFYLVPPVTAVMTYLMFDETLGPVALAGMAVTVLGVALVVKKAAPKMAAQ